MTFNPADDPASPLNPATRDTRLSGDRIDRSQETYEPSPHASRRIPPSGDVSHDGKRIYPQPGLSSRILVWGGIVAAAAAATAGGILAVRTVVDGIAGSDEDDAVEAARQRARARARNGKAPKLPRNTHAGPKRRGPRPERNAETHLAPRFAEMDEGEREAVRSRDRDLREADRRRIEQQRQAARTRGTRPRPATAGKLGFLDGLNTSIADVTRSIEAVVGAVTVAVEGFKGVAGQAGGIVKDFHDAADNVKSMLDIAPGASKRREKPEVSATTGRSHTSHPTPAGDEIVDLRDTALADRTHRL